MLTVDLFTNISVNLVNQTCRELHPTLLLAEAYHPKPVHSLANSELRLWSAVTNMYGLFYDCMPYIFRVHNKYQYKAYDNQTRSLLSIMLDNGAISRNDFRNIGNYSKALTELRGIYCHNKPPETIAIAKLRDGFGSFDWSLYHHNRNSATETFDFDAAFNHFSSVTSEIMHGLVSGIQVLISKKDASIITEWHKALIGWYLQADEIRFRSINTLRSVHGRQFSPREIIDQKLKVDLRNGQHYFRCGLSVLDLFHEVVDRMDTFPSLAHPHEVWNIVLEDILL
ncbi:hypothetical protein [Cohnella abietis]|uniref:Uncharacterized protein n=1 Tax=Cohnella abietis TaxID=2507935 RepID=A0A3T1D7D6_9BACL|nr:hypothetical protein [Cohnella abietis]BBI33965.1 hypothetical protein KCTCHS21_33640 [Cohnella abietis]